MVPTMPAPPASRYPPNRPAATLSTDERVKRSEYARDNIAALARGQPLEMRGKDREDRDDSGSARNARAAKVRFEWRLGTRSAT